EPGDFGSRLLGSLLRLSGRLSLAKKSPTRPEARADGLTSQTTSKPQPCLCSDGLAHLLRGCAAQGLRTALKCAKCGTAHSFTGKNLPEPGNSGTEPGQCPASQRPNGCACGGGGADHSGGRPEDAADNIRHHLCGRFGLRHFLPDKPQRGLLGCPATDALPKGGAKELPHLLLIGEAAGVEPVAFKDLCEAFFTKRH